MTFACPASSQRFSPQYSTHNITVILVAAAAVLLHSLHPIIAVVSYNEVACIV